MHSAALPLKRFVHPRRNYFSLWLRNDKLRRCGTAAIAAVAAVESGDGCEPFIVVLWNVAINSNLSKSGRWKSGIGRNLTGRRAGAPSISGDR